MTTREHLCEHDLVAIALAHLLTVDGDHIIMQPVTGRHMLIANGTLRDLAFMMGELKVHSTAMDIEFRPQVFGAHSGAFDMPAREAFAPGALPTHDMFFRSSLPE